ncbi:hypothetical protein FPZ54_16480 [Sphingomonas suaedae]|uniref:Uncharacterized protein n=1 Tax=Sphingomonas suaedae TaxID=2599297 RepID=A0A518RJ24_9SPHN|nr:hypothetical protein [Sphingomonas suaedae]QDX27444.1 hypothetical protein FPZ54_16480 [Sphingomonas suaedae]
MAHDQQRAEVDRNYDAFTRSLGGILAAHRDQFALMRSGGIVAYFDKPGDAYREGVSRYPDMIFSIQEVTDEPIDLGFWSHVAHD